MKKNFKGYVKMYDDVYYVDTETGEGTEKVLKKMDPLLCKMASKTYMPGYTFEDIKQELAIMAIKGIKSYDATRATALSTFLHGHLRNKLISKLKSENKMSNDANLIYTEDKSGAKIRRAKEELSFSQCGSKYNDGEEVPFEYSLEESDSFYKSPVRRYDDVNFEVSIRKISKNLDKKTSKILELICFEDYTIKDAAAEVGLSGWAASIRIKNLAKKHSIKSVLGK
jgi:RNA polymerase sigma factor (sigma-70 family)